jgi:FtsP/CotA-like multicopper oxidase with cupredoxin domain
MWTYAGTYPGPTIRRPAGKDTKITFVNRLGKSAGSVTVHLHGDHHASRNDGQPASHLIKPGKRRTYNYPLTNNGRPERAAFDFYHDHRMDLTSRNNWQGLEGMFIIDGANSHGLPTGKYDVPLLISDRSFTAHNRLANPFPKTPTMRMTGPDAPPGDGTVGDRVLVDGRYAPYLNVSAHRYRLRLLNGSNFQSYDFALSDHRSFVQVGTGSGLLPKPVRRHDILLGPAQRADVIIDFRGEFHKRIVLESIPRSDHSPSGIGTPAVSVMQFRVKTKARDTTRIPSRLERPPALRIPRKVSATWTFGLGGNTKTGTYWTVNGKPYDPKRVDLRVPLGATQTWLLKNTTSITHYIHIHEEEWHTVRRDGKRPPPWERGLEDTWRLDPGETVRVAAKFTDYTGVFMIHCHMLDHEDHGMMAQFAVAKRGAKAASRLTSATAADDGMGGMDMSAMAAAGPVVATSDAAPVVTSSWHRTGVRFLTALGVQFAVLGLAVVLLGYRRRFDPFSAR